MDFQNILYKVEAGIATITINREKMMNALNIETIQEVGIAVKNAEKDNEVAGIILTGAGDKAFIAGADIKEFSNFSKDEGYDMSAAGHEVFNSVENCRKPVIAAINGFALGGGCELAMACHIRIASSNAKFGQPEVNLGLIPGYGGTQRLIRYIGMGRALELLLTGDMIDAESAEKFGLVNRVVEPSELIPACQKILSKIAKKSPLNIAQILRLANAYNNSQEDGFSFEMLEFGNSFSTEDFKEGVDAFINKRKPVFIGK